MIYAVVTQYETRESIETIDSVVWPADPEEWGESPEAEAGQQAMMALLEGGG